MDCSDVDKKISDERAKKRGRPKKTNLDDQNVEMDGKGTKRQRNSTSEHVSVWQRSLDSSVVFTKHKDRAGICRRGRPRKKIDDEWILNNYEPNSLLHNENTEIRTDIPKESCPVKEFGNKKKLENHSVCFGSTDNNAKDSKYKPFNCEMKKKGRKKQDSKIGTDIARDEEKRKTLKGNASSSNFVWQRSLDSSSVFMDNENISNFRKRGRPKHVAKDSKDNANICMAEGMPISRKRRRSKQINLNETESKIGKNEYVYTDNSVSSDQKENHWERLASEMKMKIGKGGITCEWNRRCNSCGLELLNTERKGFCCNKGKWRLPQLPQLPQRINELYSDPKFSKDSRKVNNLFCFTILGVNGLFVPLRAPSSVSIMGRTYHRLLPASQEANPLQWYIYDESERYDMARAHLVKFEWVSQIASMLNSINPFARALKNIAQLEKKDVMLTISGTTAKDEIAAIADVSNTVTIEPRQIGFWLQHEGSPRFINILDPLYETLQYPLFFPHGTLGWHPRNEFGLSQIEWYRQRILHEPRFSQLGRLCGEYLVDMFSRTEDQRLNCISTEGFTKKHDSGKDDFGDSTNDAGDDIILPSSFLGCRRWCTSQVVDAIALARSKGHPTFFITMTTNPDWHEIRQKVTQGRTTADFPVVVCRAFHVRLHRLKKLLKRYFGRISYMIHVIKFQKRGLPHAHLVLQTEIDIPISAIDEIICAELPTDISERIRVEKYMVHYHSSRCSDGKPCCWNFPKPITTSTYVDEKGYVQYRRRHEEDRSIVPYNQFLLEQLDCHITVDITSTVHIFSYLYSYIYKGFDSVKYQLQTKGKQTRTSSANICDGLANIKKDENDPKGDCEEKHPVNEVHDYLNARYLSATEATWQILGYNITKKTPAVKCLPLHLPGQNKQQFNRKGKSSSSLSLLDRYFLRPANPEFDKITYVEYYEKYMLLPDKLHLRREQDSVEIYDGYNPVNIVRKRGKNTLVCRIRLLLPRVGEAFYLRQLLLHKAYRSWADVKTVDNVEYPTYQKAAEALGLTDAKNESYLVMEEAVALALTPNQLRFLFALLLMDQAPTAELWNKYKDVMAKDMLDRYTDNNELAYNECLHLINETLLQHSTSVAAFGLPIKTYMRREIVNELSQFAYVDVYSMSFNQMLTSFNKNQHEVFDVIRSMIDKRSPTRPIFIDGKAGTGKTYLLNAVYLYTRASKLITLPYGTTTLAALLYPGGKTAHSLFQIPVVENNVDVHSLMSKKSGYAELLMKSSVIIWDEFSMANKAVILAVNNLLQDLCENKEPFGGKCIITAGDFRQVAPIVRGAGKTAAINASIKSCSLWSHFEILKLHEAVRNAEDKELIDYVDQIGEDFRNPTVSIKLFATTTSLDDAIKFLYPPAILKNSSQCEKMRIFICA